MIRPPLAIAALTLALLAPPLTAQRPSPDSLPEGTVVRVTAAPGVRIVGRVHAYRADTLVLIPRAGFDTASIPLSAVQRLEISAGARRRVLAGALVGLAAGAATGAVVGHATYRPARCDGPGFCVEVFDRNATTALGAFIVGGLGLVTGMIIGAQPVEDWTALKTEHAARLHVAPTSDGVRVGVAVRR